MLILLIRVLTNYNKMCIVYNIVYIPLLVPTTSACLFKVCGNIPEMFLYTYKLFNCVINCVIKYNLQTLCEFNY